MEKLEIGSIKVPKVACTEAIQSYSLFEAPLPSLHGENRKHQKMDKELDQLNDMFENLETSNKQQKKDFSIPEEIRKQQEQKINVEQEKEIEEPIKKEIINKVIKIIKKQEYERKEKEMIIRQQPEVKVTNPLFRNVQKQESTQIVIPKVQKNSFI